MWAAYNEYGDMICDSYSYTMLMAELYSMGYDAEIDVIHIFKVTP